MSLPWYLDICVVVKSCVVRGNLQRKCPPQL